MTKREPAIDTGVSPFHDLIGLRLVEWREDFARAQIEIAEHHLNRSGVVHGGVLMSLLDQIGGFSGLYCTVPGNARFAVSLSITCSFLGQASSGVLTAIGRKVGGGRRVFYTRTEVQDARGNALALGQGVHRYRTGSESPDGAPAGEALSP
jgi:uncharacterized protein (TIGR00369 family)